MFFRKGRGSGEGGSASEVAPVPAASPAASPDDQGLRLPPSPAEPALHLDNRGLQPPEPMVRILSALYQLQPGQVLQAHNDRKPMFLLPHLDERGFAYAMADQDDGSVIIRIWHRDAGERAEERVAQRAGTEAGAQPGSASQDRAGAPREAHRQAFQGEGDTSARKATAADEPAEVAAATSAPAGARTAQPDAGVRQPGPAGGAAGEAGDAGAVPAGVEPLVMDVRPYFARRQEPFRDIMANVARLKPGQPFVLIVGFEPVPLYWVMKRKGFQHRAERQPDGAWRVTFWRPQR